MQLRRALKASILVGWILVKPAKTEVTLNAMQSDGLLTMDDVQAAVDALEDRRLAKILQKYIDLFRGIPKGLPPDRWIDHVITLEPDASPYCGRTYRLSLRNWNCRSKSQSCLRKDGLNRQFRPGEHQPCL